MKIKFYTAFLFSLAVIGVCGLGMWWYVPQKTKSLPVGVQIGSERYTLEVAATEEERAQGLGGREALCESCAMLFIFEKPARYPFWMQDMRFSLDIVWLLDTQVVAIKRAVPPESREILYPENKANFVLELPAGKAQDLQGGESILFLY